MKDGYTGNGIVLTVEDALAVEDRREEFAAYVRPRNIVEAELMARMALASVRMARCQRVEEARLEKRRAAVESSVESERMRRLQWAQEVFAADCKRGLSLLMEFSLGCDELRKSWEELAEVLASRGSWDDADLAFAQRLLGAEPTEPNLEEGAVWLLRVQNVLARRSVDHETVAAALKKFGHERVDVLQELLLNTFGSAEPTPQQALAELRDFVAEQIESLSERARMLWSQCERNSYANECAIALVDSSAEGTRLARYEAMNEMSFHRNWNAIQRLRKQDEPSSKKIRARAQNEPKMACSSPESADVCDSSSEPAKAAQGCAFEPSRAEGECAGAVSLPFEPSADRFEAPALAAISV